MRPVHCGGKGARVNVLARARASAAEYRIKLSQCRLLRRSTAGESVEEILDGNLERVISSALRL